MQQARERRDSYTPNIALGGVGLTLHPEVNVDQRRGREDRVNARSLELFGSSGFVDIEIPTKKLGVRLGGQALRVEAEHQGVPPLHRNNIQR